MTMFTYMGITTHNKTDFDKVKKDLMKKVDPDILNEQTLFLHWTSTKRHDLNTFDYLAKKHPDLKFEGYSEHEYLYMGPNCGGLKIHVDHGNIKIKEYGLEKETPSYNDKQ